MQDAAGVQVAQGPADLDGTAQDLLHVGLAPLLVQPAPVHRPLPRNRLAGESFARQYAVACCRSYHMDLQHAAASRKAFKGLVRGFLWRNGAPETADAQEPSMAHEGMSFPEILCS